MTQEKLNTKKVRGYMKSLNELEFIYLEHHVWMRRRLMNVYRENSLTKEDICQAFGIKPSQFTRFMAGDFNYTMTTMAHLNLLIEKLKQ